MKMLFLTLSCFVMAMAAYPQFGKKDVAIQLHFQNMVGESILQLGETYFNKWQEPFRIRSCKYYISHLQLIYKNGEVYSAGLAPHLVNEADSNSKHISLTAPAGDICNIRFLLGVDSITNTRGVQTGDLDPAKGMFWVWNTGYIMAKLEGTSPLSKAPGKSFSYDVGGFKNGENAARTIILTIPLSNVRKPATLFINADVSKWFYGKHEVRIANQPMCHSPGELATQIADNYTGMFSLKIVD